MRRIRRWWPAAVLLAVCLAVFGLGSLRRESDGQSLLHVAESVPLEVRIDRPLRREVVRLVQVPGDVEAVLEVDISSEVVAQIEEMPVQEGQRIDKGDLLCRLDDDNLRADVESGQARVERIKASISQAEAEHEEADRDMQRQIRLSESNATSVDEMADYRTALKRAMSSLEMRRQELIEAEAFLRRVEEDLKRTVIQAPISGVVSQLNAKQGEVVVTGTMNNPGTVIMTISDLSRMQVRARVDEIDAPLVKAGQDARVYLQADQEHPVPARVLRIAAKGSKLAGRDVVNFETVLEVLSSDSRIMPGMTANVEIEVARSLEAMTVPVEAVVHRLRKDLAPDIVAEFDRRQNAQGVSATAREAQYIKVIYVKSNDAARLRLVETGIADSKRVELLGGVALEEEVIIGPYRSLDQLKDGCKVALLQEGPKEGQKDSAEQGTDEDRTAQSQPQESDDKEAAADSGGQASGG
jgi:HlyD family secretion protein